MIKKVVGISVYTKIVCEECGNTTSDGVKLVGVEEVGECGDKQVLATYTCSCGNTFTENSNNMRDGYLEIKPLDRMPEKVVDEAVSKERGKTILKVDPVAVAFNRLAEALHILKTT